MTSVREALVIDEDLAVDVDAASVDTGLDLFNTRAFHDLHRTSATNGCYLVLRHRRSGAALGAVHFLESAPGHFASPHRGSFGGYQVVEGTELSLLDMERFVASVESILRDGGARSVTLVMAPMAYHLHETSAWLNVLLRTGYAVARHELNYAIDVGGSFVEGLDRGNRKQLRKGDREGLTAHRLERPEFAAAYQVIVENRQQKGRIPSMTWPALVAMCDCFPDRMRFFGVRQEGALVAAAVCILVNARALYVFYWGDVAGVGSLSPVTVLARHIHEHCVASGITLLDLGTATVDGIPDHGLVRYKKHLGSRESLKLTLRKSLT